MMNLIMNASDALGGHPGDIRVETSVRAFPEDGVFRAVGGGIPTPGRYVQLEVADTGCGMSEETAARIFEPFFTTKFAGRGLGLASTLGIMRAHGGFVALRTREGHGTSLVVLFPALAVGPGKAEPDGRGRTAWTAGGTVLVIDDEPAVRGLARAVLSRAGFSVLDAADGRTGLDVLLRREVQVDAVLMDVSMPELDGTEVLALLREDFPHLPVLMSSGYPPEGLVGGETGPTGFLKKPYAPVELVDTLSQLLHRMETGGGEARGRERA